MVNQTAKKNRSGSPVFSRYYRLLVLHSCLDQGLIRFLVEPVEPIDQIWF